MQEIVDQTGEDPLTVKEAFAAAVKQELRGLQESLRVQVGPSLSESYDILRYCCVGLKTE